LHFFSNFLFLRKNKDLDVLVDMNEMFTIKNTHPLIGVSLFINMLSFAGVPPFIGFFGKFYLLSYLWWEGFFFSLVTVLIVSLLSAFYYIRLARSLFIFTSVRLLFKEISFMQYFIIFIFLIIQIFFIFFLFFYFSSFVVYFELVSGLLRFR